MSKPKSQEQFIEDCIKVHGNTYDYSNTIYKNKRTKVSILCRTHGEFFQTPDSHINGKNGCSKCGHKSLSRDEFIKECNSIHENFYIYDNTFYTHSHGKIKITCPIHGEFSQKAYSHMQGHGCAKCYGFVVSTEDFIKESSIVHHNKYDYSKTEYINASTKVIIICPTHGEFEQSPHDHKNGKKGCKKCNLSRGELLIDAILSNSKYTYISQYKFEDCRNILPLPFDFYIPELNLCIEYDGLQHQKPIDYFGGESAYQQRKINDQIKTQYCKSNDIRLLRISYNEHISEKMSEFIPKNS